MSFFAFHREMDVASLRRIVTLKTPQAQLDQAPKAPSDGDFWLGLIVACALSAPVWLLLILALF